MKTLCCGYFVFLMAVLTGGPSLAAGASCIPVAKHGKIFRFPVVLKGPGWVIGSAIDRIESWSLKGSKWSKVPLQIDEVNDEENYVLEGGLPFTSNTDDGFFDRNDELSVKAGSLGETFDPKKIPKEIRSAFAKFAKVDFCGERDGYLGSLLIGELKSAGERPIVKSLFDPATSAVETSKYRYVFRADQPMLIGDVMIKSKDGPKKVFAGSSFVMPLIPKFFMLPSLYFGEKDFTSEIESWRSGPVRSIVAVGAKMRRFFGMLNLHLFSELVFYEDYFQIPTKIEFIFDPSTFLDRGSGLSYILKYPEGAEWSLDSNLDGLPSSGPMKGPLQKTAYDQSPTGVFSVKGHSPLGSFLANVRVDSKALKLAPPPYLAKSPDFSDKDRRTSWPWLKRADGSLAVFIDISGVKRGLYDFALDVALSNQADDGFTDFQTVSASWHDPITN